MNCQIAEQFFNVLRLLQEDHRKPRDYGSGQLLYYTEVMFLDTVARSPDANVSQLANLLGTTKGAITQLAARLSEKELIEVYRRQGNKKEKYYRLTPLGETVRAGHSRYHEAANTRLCNYFSSLNAQEVTVIHDFLIILQECAPFSQFTCKYLEDRRKEVECDGKDASIN